jgi:hypothetical protein
MPYIYYIHKKLKAQQLKKKRMPETLTDYKDPGRNESHSRSHLDDSVKES